MAPKYGKTPKQWKTSCIAMYKIIRYHYPASPVLFLLSFSVYMEQCVPYPVTINTVKFLILRFDMCTIKSEWLCMLFGVLCLLLW